MAERMLVQDPLPNFQETILLTLSPSVDTQTARPKATHHLRNSNGSSILLIPWAAPSPLQAPMLLPFTQWTQHEARYPAVQRRVREMRRRVHSSCAMDGDIS